MQMYVITILCILLGLFLSIRLCHKGSEKCSSILLLYSCMLVPLLLFLGKTDQNNIVSDHVGTYRIDDNSLYCGVLIALDNNKKEYWISDNYTGLFDYSFIHGYYSDYDAKSIKLNCDLLGDPFIVLTDSKMYVFVNVNSEMAVMTADLIDRIIVTASSEDKMILDYTKGKKLE